MYILFTLCFSVTVIIQAVVTFGYRPFINKIISIPFTMKQLFFSTYRWEQFISFSETLHPYLSGHVLWFNFFLGYYIFIYSCWDLQNGEEFKYYHTKKCNMIIKQPLSANYGLRPDYIWCRSHNILTHPYRLLTVYCWLECNIKII